MSIAKTRVCKTTLESAVPGYKYPVICHVEGNEYAAMFVPLIRLVPIASKDPKLRKIAEDLLKQIVSFRVAEDGCILAPLRIEKEKAETE